MKITRRLATAAISVAMATGALVATSAVTAPAQATWGNPTVTVKGTARCTVAAGPIQGVSVRGVLNNQYQSTRDTLTANGATPYSVTFTNVPGGSGGWAWFWVNCASQGSHGKWVNVYRPLFGTTMPPVDL